MQYKHIKKISFALLLSLFLVSSFAHVQAETPGTELETPKGAGTSADNPLVPCGGPKQEDCTPQDFVTVVQNILNIGFMFAGFIVAGLFMYAGFLLITSVGDPGKIQKAKNIFKRTVVGFIIMFLAYLTVKNLIDNLKLDDSIKPIFDKIFQ